MNGVDGIHRDMYILWNIRRVTVDYICSPFSALTIFFPVCARDAAMTLALTLTRPCMNLP